jgi:simple sugar transport system ATP-binding protein
VDDSVADRPPRFEMRAIVKRYGRTVALNGVDFDAAPGEIHALLGENGAGKSTLMHVLAGLTWPDGGEIRLNGRPARIASPTDARRHGIAMVHQHFTLVPAFTVLENLTLSAGRDPNRGSGATPARSARAMAESAIERARSLGWTLDADARVASLSVGVQQRIEIVKALATEADTLIFDEPTAVLAPKEIEELFAVLRRLRDEGRTVTLITHKLGEILAVADRVTVLRRGLRIATAQVAETTAEQLAEWMVGSAPDSVASEALNGRAAVCSSPVETASRLTVRGLSVAGDRGDPALRGIDFEVAAGEIYGVGGVDGNGQSELAEALTGLRPASGGSILWRGKPLRRGRGLSIGYIPQDRRRSGLALSMTVEENLILSAIDEPANRRGPLLNRRALRSLSAGLAARFDVRASSLDALASSLSGGNQQKVVVARELHTHPELVVAVNPTRGLDIAATGFVHEQLFAARDRGAAVVLISTDLDEISALCARAAILSGGRLQPFEVGRAGAMELGLLLGGIHAGEPHPAPSTGRNEDNRAPW